jgi:hypothetical protein
MTIFEQHIDFKFKVDKVASFTKEDFNVAEIDWLLNEGQNVFTKQRYGTSNNTRSGFETTQKRIDDLASLHVKFPEQPAIVATTVTSGVHEVVLSDLIHSYWFLTRGYVTVSQTDCPDKNIKLRQIDNDDLSDALGDSFHQSSVLDGVLCNFGKASATTGESSIYIYPGTLTIGDVFIEYIKKPVQMFYGGYTYIDGSTPTTTNCELPEHTHSEIVDIAVNIAAGIIEHPTYAQLKQQKVFKHE